LPDGIFSYQKFKFGNIVEGLGMENGNPVYLWPFGIFYCHRYIFLRFDMFYKEKSGNPGNGYFSSLL
jgi:hypothetical protein